MEREIKTDRVDLSIDSEKVTGIIVDFIRGKVKKEQNPGVLLGLSGGIDSAVVATLAAQALGPEKVYTWHLFDRDSDKRSLIRAKAIADKLGIRFEAHSIAKVAEEMGLPGRPGLVSPFPGIINRVFLAWARSVLLLFSRQHPYIWYLKREEPENFFTRWVYRVWVHRSAMGFDTKHKLRKTILEKYAVQNNLLLVGAANKSEAMVGWFVKDGVDDLPIEPIGGLYKTQVRQLADYLKISQEITDLIPSPDMTHGITDEAVIGIKYKKLDIALYLIEHGYGRDSVEKNGLGIEEFEHARALNTFSTWKRANPHEIPVN